MATLVFIRKDTYRNRYYCDMCYKVTEKKWYGYPENCYASSILSCGTDTFSVTMSDPWIWCYKCSMEGRRIIFSFSGKYATSSLQAWATWLEHSGPFWRLRVIWGPKWLKRYRRKILPITYKNPPDCWLLSMKLKRFFSSNGKQHIFKRQYRNKIDTVKF